MIHANDPDEFEYPIGIPLTEFLLAGVTGSEVAERPPDVEVTRGEFRWGWQIDGKTGEVVGGQHDVLVRIDAVVGRRGDLLPIECGRGQGLEQ